jgi:hypothetical protein
MSTIQEKIQKIEALIAKSTETGEIQAARAALERMQQIQSDSPDTREMEFSIYTTDNWHKRLLQAICRKYGLKPFRYHKQKYTTVMVRTSKDFMNKVLWKEYQEYALILEGLVEEITGDLINKIHQDQDEDLISGQLGE